VRDLEPIKKETVSSLYLFKKLIYICYLAKLSPPPDAYNIPTVFSPNNTTSTFAVHCKGQRTFAFGTGREAFGKTVINRENL